MATLNIVSTVRWQFGLKEQTGRAKAETVVVLSARKKVVIKSLQKMRKARKKNGANHVIKPHWQANLRYFG